MLKPMTSPTLSRKLRTYMVLIRNGYANISPLRNWWVLLSMLKCRRSWPLPGIAMCVVPAVNVMNNQRL